MLSRKPKDFRYVFPSQGKAMLRHNRIILGWSIAAGVIVSVLIALLLWIISNRDFDIGELL